MKLFNEMSAVELEKKRQEVLLKANKESEGQYLMVDELPFSWRENANGVSRFGLPYFHFGVHHREYELDDETGEITWGELEKRLCVMTYGPKPLFCGAEECNLFAKCDDCKANGGSCVIGEIDEYVCWAS